MTRQISANGKALIKRFEGCKLRAYPDPATGGDPWTIGWGTTGADIVPGLTWTQAQADARFADDLARFAAKVAALINGAPTTQGQFDALVSFAYNVGLGNLKGSTLLKSHKAGRWLSAKAEFSRWNKADGKVMPGLTTRRAAESALYGIGA
jgi:lysozyme